MLSRNVQVHEVNSINKIFCARWAASINKAIVGETLTRKSLVIAENHEHYTHRLLSLWPLRKVRTLFKMKNIFLFKIIMVDHLGVFCTNVEFYRVFFYIVII